MTGGSEPATRQGGRAAIHPLAVIHGRFQPLHNGHLEYLLAGAARCSELIVGITNPDPALTVPEATDPLRGEPAANPCTYWERYLMVEGALTEAGVSRENLRIVPLPHGSPERLHHYAPRDAVYLLTIYDAWGETKLHRFAALGLRTEVLWRRRDKPTSGSIVRRRMAAGETWRHLVPPAVAAVVERYGVDDRIRAHAHGRAS